MFIIYTYLLTRLMVILNSQEAMKQAMVHQADDFSHTPYSGATLAMNLRDGKFMYSFYFLKLY